MPQQEIRIKVEVTIDGLQINNEPRRYGYIIIRPRCAAEVGSLYDLISAEVPLSQIQGLKPCPEHGFTLPTMYHDVLYWLQLEAEMYIVGRLDQFVNIEALSLEALINIRAEYELLNWWDYIPDYAWDESYDRIIELADLIDELIDERDVTDLREQMRQSAKGKARPGFVYLLRSATGHWKIGRTINPASRMKTFGIQLPFEVEFDHLIPTSHMAEAEIALHDRYAAKRINGEWFALDDADVAYIKSIKTLEL